MMEKACFSTQVSYCLAMSFVRELLENKLITEGEMVAIEEALSASEKPLIRELISSINLT
ncbi:MAG: SHOCT domain-containing protein [Sphaerochaetaceae bacterium]